MSNTSKLTDRESLAINIMKALAILSVIAAHLISFSPESLFSRTVSAFWVLFGEIGVVVFFVLGGFLYHREPGDHKAFWKKKFFRILLPWLFCSLITYLFSALTSRSFRLPAFLKWVFGSGTWYYYITVYTLFLFIFDWLSRKTALLWALLGVQVLALILICFGISTTPPLGFLTDYLNPLHWIGYFSLGILIRRFRPDVPARKQRLVFPVACILGLLLFWLLAAEKIFTYFHIFSALFCLCWLVVIWGLAYWLSKYKAAKLLGKIGSWSYCIYLLHMQIVLYTVPRLPSRVLYLLFAPVLGLAVMVLLITLGLFICSRLPGGQKMKSLFGL